MNIYVIISIPLAIIAALATLIYLKKTHRDPGGVYPDKDLRPKPPRSSL